MRSLLRGGMPSHQGAGAGRSLGGTPRSAKEGRCTPVSLRTPCQLPAPTRTRTHQAVSSLFSTCFREFKCKVKGCSFFLLSWEENIGFDIPSCGSVGALRGQVCAAGTRAAIRGRARMSWKQQIPKEKEGGTARVSYSLPKYVSTSWV